MPTLGYHHSSLCLRSHYGIVPKPDRLTGAPGEPNFRAVSFTANNPRLSYGSQQNATQRTFLDPVLQTLKPRIIGPHHGS
jgi:hypothetical protein